MVSDVASPWSCFSHSQTSGKRSLFHLQMRHSFRWASRTACKRMWAAAAQQHSWWATPSPRRQTTVSALRQHGAARIMLCAMVESVHRALQRPATGMQCEQSQRPVQTTAVVLMGGFPSRVLPAELQGCTTVRDPLYFSILFLLQIAPPMVRSCRTRRSFSCRAAARPGA